MLIQKNKPEQIVTVLRQIEVQIANGKKVHQACKEAGNHTQTYYRWRKEYGGLKLDQARRLKELEKENAPHPAVPASLAAGRLPRFFPNSFLSLLLHGFGASAFARNAYG